jgi:hypothetical protein
MKQTVAQVRVLVLALALALALAEVPTLAEMGMRLNVWTVRVIVTHLDRIRAQEKARPQACPAMV